MIKVQVDELDADLNTLNSAIEDFKSYSDGFINDAIDAISDSNSDFTSKIKEALEKMTDSKAPDLLEKIQEYHDNGVTLSKTFRETDESIAQSEEINK